MTPPHLDPARTAALFMDFQHDVCARGGRMVSQDAAVLARFAAAIDQAARLQAATRAAGLPLLHVRHAMDPGYPQWRGLPHHSGMHRYVQAQGAFLEGDPGAEIVPALAPRPGEAVLRKHTLSPFASTDLAARLAAAGCDTVLLAGVVTHYVILATAFDAYDRGLRVVVASDACASGTEERHAVALAILGPVADLVSVDDLAAILA